MFNTKHLVIVDFDSFDKYAILSKKEYNKKALKNEILYQGSLNNCTQWVEDNPHPEAHDYGVYFGDNDGDDDENEIMFV